MWTALTALFLVFLVVVVGSAIWLTANMIGFLQPILIPVAIAAILAYLLDPVVTHLSNRGFGRTKAIVLLFAVAFLALGGLGAWLVPTISLQSANAAKELPEYTRKARDAVVDLIYRYDRAFGMPGGAKGKSSAATSFVDWLLASPARPSSAPDVSPTPAAATSPRTEEIAPAPAKLTSAERQRIQEWVQKQLPNLQNQIPYLSDKLWQLLQKSIGGFLGATGFLLSLIMVPIYLFFCLVDGLLIGTALLILGLNFAPLIGCLVVVLTMIPYIGIVLCWIPAVLIAAFQWGDWMHPLIVTGIFILIQNLEGMFYAPRIVGNSVGLHPMTVIVSIFVWGLLIGGLLGPILAVPLTATIKVLLARYVWGRRLREEVIDSIEEVPVVRESERAANA